MPKEFNLTAPMRERILACDDLSTEQKRKAALLVASNATDVQDCADLLGYLGLMPEDGGADIVRALERTYE